MDGTQLVGVHPLRTVDWRRQACEQIFRAGRFPTRHHFDATTCAIVRYLGWRGRAGRLANDAAPREFEALHAAYELHERCAPRLRAAVEAAILADEARDSIAARLGVSEACVEWYEIVFFDVRSRLSATAFIVHDVIEGYRQRSPHDWPQYGWKLVAYLAGSRALEEVMGIEKVADLPHWLAQLQHETRLMLREQLRAVAQRLTIDNPSAVTGLLREVEGTGGKSSQEIVPSEIYQHVAAMLKEIPWLVGRGKNDDSPLAEFEKGALELRADEMLRVVMGETLPNAEELKMKQLPLPAPKQDVHDSGPFSR